MGMQFYETVYGRRFFDSQLEALVEYFKKYTRFQFSEFFNVLKEKGELEKKISKDSNVLNNIQHLLTRLEPYSKITKFAIIPDYEMASVEISGIIVLQLSTISEASRKFLTEVILLTLWKEIFLLGDSKKFQTLLLDEFHNLSVKNGSAIYSFLREGRRFGVGIVLATQYITNYSEDEIETLMQAGNSLVFHPVDRNIVFSAKMIDFENAKAWHVILSRLGRGEVVLKGHFRITGKDEIIADRIICKVKG